MSNQSELILTLQQYIVELQTENKALKGHIYSLQNKQESLNSSFHDDIEKLKVYIEHCEHQIMKRQKRQIGLLELVNQLQEAKDHLTRQRDIYLTEVDTVREDIRGKDDKIKEMQHELDRNIKQIEEMAKIVQTAAAKPPPPKPSKCKQCQVYIKNTQLMQEKMEKHERTIQNLQKDITCLSQFL